MSDIETVTRLVAQAKFYRLSGADILDALTMEQIAEAYNGIGPDWFPARLREAIDRLSADLQCVALIHDVRYSFSDGSTAQFDEANAEFRANGEKVANAKYPWYSLRRYGLRSEARLFAKLCQDFGFAAYIAAFIEIRKMRKRMAKGLAAEAETAPAKEGKARRASSTKRKTTKKETTK